MLSLAPVGAFWRGSSIDEDSGFSRTCFTGKSAKITIKP